MRRLWFGLIMLAPACLPTRGAAAEVIASSTARQPVAAHSEAEAPVAPIGYWGGGEQAGSPAVSLGQPRGVRVPGTFSAELSPRSPVEPIGPPQLSRVPAFAPAPASHQPTLQPEPATVPPPPPPRLLANSESQSAFAAERGNWLDDVNLLPVAGMGVAGTPERLSFAPQPAHVPQAPYAVDSGYMSEPDAYGAAEGLFEEGYEEAPGRTRFYGGVEYLMWWTKGDKVPVLASTSANADAGVLNPGNTTQVLFGGGDLDHNLQSGARFRLGYWFDTPKPLALEGSFFFLGRRSDGFATPFSDRLLARPFFDLNNGVESSELIAFPGQFAGRILVDAPSSLYGGDANLRCNLCCMDQCWGNVKVDALAGFRYLNLREGLHIREEGSALLPQINPDGSPSSFSAFRIEDRFDTQNRFYGGQVGLATEWKRGPWSLAGRSTVALGVTHQVIDITGSGLFFNRNGTISHERGGLLALNSNSGHFTRNRFGVVPEASMTVGYQVTDWMKATVGYNCLVWTNVVRPGEQIDRGLDIRQIPRFVRPGDPPTPLPSRPGPLVPFKESTYWAQGLTLGLEFNY